METATQARAGAPATGEPAISLRDLRRDYDERPVLRGVSLELEPGAALAVIGANGAGKSTLLRILATLLRPSAGEVEVLGASLPREAWKIRGRVGYLGHEPLLYRELSVRENLELNARLHRVEDPSARIANLLERAGLAGRAGELVRNLSAGMLQRAAICRALVHAPDLLLLDEPRSHLDLGAAGVVDELLGPAAGAHPRGGHARDRLRLGRGRRCARAARRRLGRLRGVRRAHCRSTRRPRTSPPRRAAM